IVAMAVGGSTNVTLHTPEIARAAGFADFWNDVMTPVEFNHLSQHIVPVLTDARPYGKYSMVDIDRVGGVQMIVRELLEAGLLAALDKNPGQFQNHDMIIVRYEGPSGAPGMPEMLDPTSRITTLCRERGIVVGLMTDARFSGGSVGLVIGHVGPEAGLGGPI